MILLILEDLKTSAVWETSQQSRKLWLKIPKHQQEGVLINQIVAKVTLSRVQFYNERTLPDTPTNIGFQTAFSVRHMEKSTEFRYSVYVMLVDFEKTIYIALTEQLMHAVVYLLPR